VTRPPENQAAALDAMTRRVAELEAELEAREVAWQTWTPG
jgi:hypothetical protein